MKHHIKLKEPYQPAICPHCHQSLTYLLPIDLGTVEIVRAIAVAIYRKNINAIHPRKEMECRLAPGADFRDMIKEGMLTSNMVGNLSRPRFHGLIAKIKDNPGNYCLTTKGARFLRGLGVPRLAVISKEERRQVGYYLPDEHMVTIHDFVADDPFWEGINFDIVEGQIIKAPEMPVRQKTLF
jgi:hypothetical protein